VPFVKRTVDCALVVCLDHGLDKLAFRVRADFTSQTVLCFMDCELRRGMCTL
jgi:hypothetical protein